jgi:molybdopterin synthase sulfur carrier subunit
MNITVRYFALLRERLGRESEVLTLDAAAPTVGLVRGLLADRAPALAGFLRGGSLLVAVNREYATADTALKDGDEVALFPPVTGG